MQVLDIIDTITLMKRLNVEREAINRWRRAGMPYMKAPGERGTVRFDYADVVAWLKAKGELNHSEGTKNG